ncbi:DLG1 protein, partial [Nothocercus nigrocapillus]|nr:DLG1 protein [Nothocercus nigrocapillus]
FSFHFLDTDRALVLLEEYCKKLRKPEEQQLKKAIRKVMGIFKSSLFQALLGSLTEKATRRGTITQSSLTASVACDVLGCPKD